MDNKKQITECKVWYLNHSGVAVKTDKHFLIFDYFPEAQGGFLGNLEDGLIDPSYLKDENVIVFSSHGHHDHWDKRILSWQKEIKQIQYVLSDDIPYVKTGNEKNVLLVSPNQSYELGDMSMKTLKSTDEGVAFLIQVDGITIYHAGDLNWWHWNGESKEYNDIMKMDYIGQIDQLKDIKIDIAFIPVDPRLEDKYILGIDYLCKQTIPEHIIPIHLWGRYDLIQEMKENSQSESYRTHICYIHKNGEFFTFQILSNS